MSREHRLLNLVLVGLALILTVSLAAWLSRNLERRMETIHDPPSAAARKNPLLAAERFLLKIGIAAESLAGRDLLRGPPSASDTLVVRGLGPMNPASRARLLGWLDAGGHLIVEAIEVWEDREPRDDFLAELGILLREPSDDEPDLSKDGWVQAQVPTTDPRRPLILSFDAGYYLETKGDAPVQIRAAGRTRLLQRQIGDGRLTVVSDSGFMTNRHIGQMDHAAFLARLVAPKPGGKVWLLYDSGMPWLGSLLWSAASEAVIAVGVLAAAWIWSIGGRLGPLLPAPGRSRRDLIEHLDASGGFLWRHERASRLVEASRRRILARWTRQHPHLARVDIHRQAAAIGEALDQPTERVLRILFTRAEGSRDFVEQARLLQSLWRRVQGRQESQSPDRLRTDSDTQRHGQRLAKPAALNG